MDSFTESFRQALLLIVSFDPEVLQTVWTSLYTSSVAIVLASFIGVPCGLLLGNSRFSGRSALITILNTLMAMPTVVIGLVIYGLISRQGMFGPLGLLFTPTAMILGQMILAAPIVTHYTMSAVVGADARIIPTVLTLGAGRLQGALQLLKEIRFGVMAAVVAGFGRVIAEVGVAMMLGGNIRGYTRTMTTAIALETSKGEFAFGLALGIVLMTVALGVNVILNQVQRR